ncbi:MAG: UDP-N-acetylglucosamine--N-acetylmuramyl-(pentapeptide) pyrophosphoryl-undecaprenol N-acetylglucosamine transferase, partial [Bacteroidales bacterium]|nr:UDP-N-acetylglucosamine--N-acetylmuramyl-(pentapeptide) pyrophosphoryl-undecaprenol N-acetylglucosamine transferase [Bacteroidales bacterium]
LGIPCLIQEQNSYPGITNKLLAKHVKKICVAYEGMEKFFPEEKIILTGNPIRKNIIDIENKKDKGINFFKLKTDKKTILMVGGSLGAQAINNAILSHIQDWGNLEAQMIWQTGKMGIEQATVATKNISSIKVHTFIKEMDLAYAAADLIISRAGAIAISEISAIGKPVIFVPLPTAAEDHQTKNAQKLVTKNAAVLVTNKNAEKELFVTTKKIINDEPLLTSMANEIKKFGVIDADDIITKEALKLIK